LQHQIIINHFNTISIMKTNQINHNVKAFNFINNLSPELQNVVISIADTIKPALDDIHANQPTSQNYYADYLRLLSYKPERSKVIAIAMLYAGANVQGVQAAMKLI
jgi:hypothetical protein